MKPLSGGGVSVRGVAILTLVLGIAQQGCDSIGGKAVVVEFSSAAGLVAGRSVYLAGVRIGTTGTPRVINGKARIPVQIYRSQSDALPRAAVFVIAKDPAEARELCLEVEPVEGIPIQLDADGKTPLYRGASSQLELGLLVGTMQAQRLWEDFTR